MLGEMPVVGYFGFAAVSVAALFTARLYNLRKNAIVGLRFERARLQSCRKRNKITAALAAKAENVFGKHFFRKL